jgi:hypothetical protein
MPPDPSQEDTQPPFYSFASFETERHFLVPEMGTAQPQEENVS